MLATGGPTELKNEMNITDDTFDKYYTLLCKMQFLKIIIYNDFFLHIPMIY